MRILLVHSFYNASLPSGENTVVKDQARLLAEQGHDVLLWGPQTPSAMTSLERARLGLNVLTGQGESPESDIASFAPDLVHVHNLFPNISSKWLSRIRVPIALSIHNYRAVCANGVQIRQGASCSKCLTGSEANALLHRCYRDSAVATVPVLAYQHRFRAAIRRHVAAVLFTSALSQDILKPILRPQRSVLLPNYVPAVTSAAPPRGIERDAFVTLGRLTPEKGLDRLLSMWPVSEELLILGDGPDRVRLESLASGKNITFLGFVSDRERDRILRDAKALILPSITKEADPVVVAQALSAGTPCIVNDGTATAVLASKSEAILPYGDRGSLLRALASVGTPHRRGAAMGLYEATWSQSSWMQTYSREVLQAIGGQPL